MSYSTFPPFFENFARDSKTEEAEGVIHLSDRNSWKYIFFGEEKKKKLSKNFL